MLGSCTWSFTRIPITSASINPAISLVIVPVHDAQVRLGILDTPCRRLYLVASHISPDSKWLSGIPQTTLVSRLWASVLLAPAKAFNTSVSDESFLEDSP